MKEYGPELIIETRFPYFQRKFKREIVYFYLMYTFPYLSYEIFREKLLFGNLNFLKIIKQAAIVLGVLGPLYAGFSSYFFYIPKEIYWENLSQKKKNLQTGQIYENTSEIDPMKPKKPFKRISLDANSKEK